MERIEKVLNEEDLGILYGLNNDFLTNLLNELKNGKEYYKEECEKINKKIRSECIAKFHPDRVNNDEEKRLMAEKISRPLNILYEYFNRIKKVNYQKKQRDYFKEFIERYNRYDKDYYMMKKDYKKTNFDKYNRILEKSIEKYNILLEEIFDKDNNLREKLQTVEKDSPEYQEEYQKFNDLNNELKSRYNNIVKYLKEQMYESMKGPISYNYRLHLDTEEIFKSSDIYSLITDLASIICTKEYQESYVCWRKNKGKEKNIDVLWFENYIDKFCMNVHEKIKNNRLISINEKYNVLYNKYMDELHNLVNQFQIEVKQSREPEKSVDIYFEKLKSLNKNYKKVFFCLINEGIDFGDNALKIITDNIEEENTFGEVYLTFLELQSKEEYKSEMNRFDIYKNKIDRVFNHYEKEFVNNKNAKTMLYKIKEKYMDMFFNDQINRIEECKNEMEQFLYKVSEDVKKDLSVISSEEDEIHKLDGINKDLDINSIGEDFDEHTDIKISRFNNDIVATNYRDKTNPEVYQTHNIISIMNQYLTGKESDKYIDVYFNADKLLFNTDNYYYSVSLDGYGYFVCDIMEYHSDCSKKLYSITADNLKSLFARLNRYISNFKDFKQLEEILPKDKNEIIDEFILGGFKRN